MDSTTKLPGRKDFYSTIQEKSISKEEHRFASQMWQTYKIKNLTDYSKLYCEIDTLLLAEIFQKFRKTMLKFGGLDPAHYISLPGFGWDIMLKTTKCVIGLPKNIDQIHFIEKGIRGGLSFINTRYKSVNSETEKGHQSIRYIDANVRKIVKECVYLRTCFILRLYVSKLSFLFFQNLYGLSQIGKLPLSGFEWMPNYHLTSFNVDDIDLDGEKGYILEVDLEYPEELHYHHNDFPLAPESYKIDLDDLSKYSKECYLKSNQNTTYKSTKLTATFLDRQNYVVHIKNLKLYMDLGMKLKKIHRILMFNQESFLEPFITKCTEERRNAKTVFEKNQFKKISNSCYGKTIENVRDYITVKIHVNEKSFKKAISKHTFKSFSIIDENLIITSHKLPEILHNKPYAVGFTILEYVSKKNVLVMPRFELGSADYKTDMLTITPHDLRNYFTNF